MTVYKYTTCVTDHHKKGSWTTEEDTDSLRSVHTSQYKQVKMRILFLSQVFAKITLDKIY